MMLFWFLEDPKCLQQFLRSEGIRFKSECEFWLGFGVGSGRAPWRNGGRVGLGKARVMAWWGSNPRVLPNLTAAMAGEGIECALLFASSVGSKCVECALLGVF